jgi:hypothetical protein
MSEFKFTKGKWEVTPYQNVYCKITKICAIGDLGEITEEVKANALLISKAPEMLDFIVNVYNTMPKGSSLQEKAKQLIKEATEL